jgi:hypothetical protein
MALNEAGKMLFGERMYGEEKAKWRFGRGMIPIR